MTALRWARRVLDGVLIAAVACVVAIAAITLTGQILGGRSLILAGGSMEPAMPRGAFLTLPVESGAYQVGDIVTVAAPGTTPYTHRISRVVSLPSGLHVETKGDANGAPEPVVIPVADLAGRVALFVPGLGYLASILASPLGLAGFLLLCATVLSTIWVIEELELRDCAACLAIARSAARPRGAGVVPAIANHAAPNAANPAAGSDVPAAECVRQADAA